MQAVPNWAQLAAYDGSGLHHYYTHLLKTDFKDSLVNIVVQLFVDYIVVYETFHAPNYSPISLSLGQDMIEKMIPKSWSIFIIRQTEL